MRLTTMIALLMQVAANNPLGPLSVPETFNNSARYDGRTVRVSGTLVFGGHGLFLEGEGCVARFNAAKHPFACAVLLDQWPDCRQGASSCSQELTGLMDKIRERVGTPRPHASIPVLLTGRLEVAPQRCMNNPPPLDRIRDCVNVGFGALNAFDVRLRVTDGRISSPDELMRPPAPK
jgi:hypothetical protein